MAKFEDVIREMQAMLAQTSTEMIIAKVDLQEARDEVVRLSQIIADLEAQIAQNNLPESLDFPE